MSINGAHFRVHSDAAYSILRASVSRPRANHAALALLPAPSSAGDAKKLHGRYLYVVVPGIRNLLEFGGAGILVYDIDNDHKFVKRIVQVARVIAIQA